MRAERLLVFAFLVLAAGCAEPPARQAPATPPLMEFHQDVEDRKLTVVEVTAGYTWQDLTVYSCREPTDGGAVEVGDQLTECHGQVSVDYQPTRQTIYTVVFP